MVRFSSGYTAIHRFVTLSILSMSGSGHGKLASDFDARLIEGARFDGISKSKLSIM